jgi:putative endonuclease
MKRGGTVYIMTNKHHTVFYTGVTADLLSRVLQHHNKDFPRSFTAKYNASKLIYYEAHSTITEAIAREKQVKKYSRIKKVNLVESINPQWRDLFDDIKDW